MKEHKKALIRFAESSEKSPKKTRARAFASPRFSCNPSFSHPSSDGWDGCDGCDGWEWVGISIINCYDIGRILICARSRILGPSLRVARASETVPSGIGERGHYEY
jgi:hypothetical protein